MALPTRNVSRLANRIHPASVRPSVLLRNQMYHSYDHPTPPPYPPAESAILSSALAHVPNHGFTQHALTLGARDAGYVDASTNLLPRGVLELVRYHLIAQRLGLRDRVQFPSDTMGLGAKVGVLAWARLLANKPIIKQWPEALAHLSTPSGVPIALSELHALSDEIWHLAGDTALDTSWYTKRASLGSVYAASELFMTQDTSPGLGETRMFLEKRLQDVQSLGSAIGAVGEWVGFQATSVVNLARSKGVRI